MYVEDKWIFDQQGRILHQMNQTCVTLQDKQGSIEIEKAVASSELDDLQHGPSRALDGNADTYWATQ